ncbi:MAG: hypothetical protein GXP29_01645, partial [Planctomycetes bacterium]|nr:hypothetical protein [Planctomycetota bacterium]
AAEAVFILDDKPPAKVSSMKALNALAKDRIVFVSLLCMEAISDEHMLTRRLKQIDDPFHARVVHSNYTTAAFALYDQIPFGGRSDHSSQMFQRQFRQNPVFREFCTKHGFDVLLDSVTDSETTSEKPVALFKRTGGGAIIVMDIDPAEAVESSLHEATPVMNLILAALGIRQQTLGQYTAIGRTQEEFHSHLCDLVERYPALSWPQERRPVDCDQPALITVGRDLNTIGLPVVLRPAIMIRSILSGADTDCAYGVLLWFKSLLRPAPFVSPYAHTLNRRFRVAWLPHAARMQRWGGWSGNSDATRHEIEAEFEPKSLAAWIDVTTSSSHEVKITTSNSEAMHERLASALPTLMEQIIGGRHFYQSPESASNNARSPRWQIDHKKIVVVSDRSAFADSIHASAAASGATLIKIEIPATHTAPFADSIWRTDYTALLLEHIVGLMMGMVMVNRDAAPLKFRWPQALAHLQKDAVLRKFNQPDVDLPLPKSRGKHIDLPAGTAVVAVM